MIITALDEFIEDQSPERGQRLYEELKQFRFNIKDVDVTSRVFTHWRKFNLIPMMPVGTWVNLDVFQFVWVQVIKDLRAFNLPLETIANVRDELFNSIRFDKSDLFDEHGQLKDAVKLSMDKEGQQEFEAAFKEDDTLFDEFFKHFRIPVFVALVLNVFYRRADYILLIDPSGRVELTSEQDWTKDYAHLQEQFNYQPVITVSMKKYLMQIASDVKLVSRVQEMNVLNDVELEVLRTMRNGLAKELRLLFGAKDGHTDLVYTFKGVTPEKDMMHVLDQFRGKKHVQLEMKTNDGKTVAYEYQRRKRMKN